ncbi:UvrD-helicase domain-containing protein, partial [Mesomycoplasma ovipneumoniae]|uniref:UvrD-helicase domain-containing protein n=1 Tax=Mesomycoplasma ovipneumoniae TaxID=29562 RepID=UPI00307FE143
MRTLSDRITKISGPPGTGKSTTLLNVVDQLLESKVAPDDIVFTTFSRAGAYEARDRASRRFKLPEKSLPHFATLHSLWLAHLQV